LTRNKYLLQIARKIVFNYNLYLLISYYVPGTISRYDQISKYHEIRDLSTKQRISEFSTCEMKKYTVTNQTVTSEDGIQDEKGIGGKGAMRKDYRQELR